MMYGGFITMLILACSPGRAFTVVKYNYNTYKNRGLPPGPISSVSVDAFLSALRPDKTPFLFFVATPKGTHMFTRTYKEHLDVQRKMKRN